MGNQGGQSASTGDRSGRSGRSREGGGAALSPARPAAPRGRPWLLADPLKRAQIVGLVAAGLTRRMAARQLRIHAETLRRSLARDPEFREQVERAEADYLARAARHARASIDDERFWRSQVFDARAEAGQQPGLEKAPSCLGPSATAGELGHAVTHEELRRVLEGLSEILLRGVKQRKDRRRMAAECRELLEGMAGG